MSTKYKPILFKGEMVRAILEGRKTQTRRLVKPQPTVSKFSGMVPSHDVKWARMYDLTDIPNQPIIQDIPVPWKVGDILYVRETWGRYGRYDQIIPHEGHFEGDMCWKQLSDKIHFYADGEDPAPPNEQKIMIGGKWHKMPSLFLKKKDARIFLEVVNVRVERLMDISIEDAKAEGITEYGEGFGKEGDDLWRNNTSVENYFWLWDKINGAGSHKENCWVWVIEFERCEKP